MKCTSCSRVVRPVVALDIDGTLGDYHTHFQSFCELYYNKKYPQLAYDGNEEFEEFLGLTKEQYRAAKLAYRQGGWKRWLPVFPGAVDFVWDISHEAELWIATTRPWQSLSSIDTDTREWLERHAMLDCVSGLLYGDDKYDQLVAEVSIDRIVAVVEDLPALVDRAKELHLPTILCQRDHNSAASGNYVPRGTLQVCHQWALERVYRWRRQQEDRNGVHAG